MVNAAGLTSRGSLLDTTSELFDAHVAVNLRGLVFARQAALRDMLHRGVSGWFTAPPPPAVIMQSHTLPGVIMQSHTLPGVIMQSHTLPGVIMQSRTHFLVIRQRLPLALAVALPGGYACPVRDPHGAPAG